MVAFNQLGAPHPYLIPRIPHSVESYSMKRLRSFSFLVRLALTTLLLWVSFLHQAHETRAPFILDLLLQQSQNLIG